MTDFRELMSQTKFYESYARFNEDVGRYETWNEAVERVMDMHRYKYKDKLTEELEELISFAEDAYKDQLILGAQRALQFGGEQLLKHQIKLYNCVSSYADRAKFFGEFMYMLLCGAGAGFSVQKHHVSKLPNIKQRSKRTLTYTVEDSIEGWANSINMLMSSYFESDAVHPEAQGKHIHFDLTQIRPKGSKISGGFLAPGPEPLRISLDKIERLLEGVVRGGDRLEPIHVYDICMFAADAVISGGK